MKLIQFQLVNGKTVYSVVSDCQRWVHPLVHPLREDVSSTGCTETVYDLSLVVEISDLTKSNNFGISEVIEEGFQSLEELKDMRPELFI